MARVKVNCPWCKGEIRKISADRALALYQKLKPYLEVVEGWGCYTPARGKFKAGDHSAWPLHVWNGPGTFPVQLRWAPGNKSDGTPRERPSFALFCRAYGLDVEADD